MALYSQTDYGRTGGPTDRHGVYWMVTFNRSCNVLTVNPNRKTAYGAKRMQNQTTISNSNSVSFLGIPVTYSRHNLKCNICAFHEEISSLVLASGWTTNRGKKKTRKNLWSLIDRLYDVRRWRHFDFANYV